MTINDILPGLAPEPTVEAHQQEFYPQTDLADAVPHYLRPGAYELVKLETSGLTSHSRQLDLLPKAMIHKESIVAKLLSVGESDLAEPLKECRTQQSFAQCQGCRNVRTFWNHCDNFYCPCCQPRMARERAKSIEWWTKLVRQPKHVVLTCRNSDTITFARVKAFKQAITKLRRTKFARNWEGGLWSLEVTNEGKGWHLHAHLLVDAKWIDAMELARTWGKLVGQDFAIVKVIDARRSDYLREVTKYAVKGSQLSSWSPSDIVHFINAFHGQRTFGVFGSLYGKRTEWKDYLDSLGIDLKKCKCGCSNWKTYTAQEWEWKQSTSGPVFTTRPNAPNPQLSLPTFDAHHSHNAVSSR